MSDLTHRVARIGDLDILGELMRLSIDALQNTFLSPAQVAASHAIMGLDRQLVLDGTYYVVEREGAVAGCGGWSRRATLYGGSHSAGRDDALLDPARDPARIRAMYTHPAFTRLGVGRRVIDVCESAAASEGFRHAELVATLAGEPLYRACGYLQIERFDSSPIDGVIIPLVRMGKAL